MSPLEVFKLVRGTCGLSAVLEVRMQEHETSKARRLSYSYSIEVYSVMTA